MFSFLTDLKTQQIIAVSVNATCIVKSALKARGETSLRVMPDIPRTCAQFKATVEYLIRS